VSREAGQAVSACEHEVSARQSIEQRAEPGLNFEDHATAARGDQRDVTRELECIAQALFGVQQDRLPLQRLAVPLGLGEIPSRQMELAEIPS
jgi:hypothetical protein